VEPKLLVRGRILTPVGVVDGELSVSGGVITGLAARGSTAPDADVKVLDAGNSFVLPGAVDAHVHCLSNPSEGIAAATLSAIAGGVTTIVEMPYDDGAPINDAQRLLAKRHAVAEKAHVDVALLATVRPVGGAEDVAALVEAGATGFKLSLFDTDRDRFPRVPDLELLAVLDAIARAGSIACFHAENDEIIKPLIERLKREGSMDPLDHCLSRPPVSESEAVLKAAEFARSTGARTHFCHLSLARSLDIVDWYRQSGADVSVETCSHYLTYTERDMPGQGARLKINPPLRTSADQDALWAGVADGRVDIVSSDHAPWLLDQKSDPMIFANHSGVPGVETLVPLVLGLGHRRGIGIGRLVDVLSTRPAARFGLRSKGTIELGKDADLIVWDPEQTTRIDSSRLHSNAGWSPYDGLELPGRLLGVVSRGEVVVDAHGTVSSQEGRGKVLSSSAPVFSDVTA